MRSTKVFFWVSDICAWVLLSIAVLGAASMPFLGFMAERTDHEPMSWPGIIGTSVLWLVVAVGAHGLTRRRPLSLALVALPAIAFGLTGSLLFALVWLASVLMVFGTPLVLVYFEARARAASRET